MDKIRIDLRAPIGTKRLGPGQKLEEISAELKSLWESLGPWPDNLDCPKAPEATSTLPLEKLPDSQEKNSKLWDSEKLPKSREKTLLGPASPTIYERSSEGFEIVSKTPADCLPRTTTENWSSARVSSNLSSDSPACHVDIPLLLPDAPNTPEPKASPSKRGGIESVQIPNFIQLGENVSFQKLRPEDVLRPPVPYEDFVLDVQVKEGWLICKDLETKKFIEELMKDSIKNFDLAWKPYTVQRLPKFVKFDKVLFGLCRVVRCVTPTDFHIILVNESESYPSELANSKWRRLIERRENQGVVDPREQKDKPRSIYYQVNKFCFKSPLELFVGLRILLWKFVVYLENSAGKEARSRARQVELVAGDLVVVTKPNVDGKGYRGVILEPMEIKLNEGEMPLKNGFLVYLMDTGETRIISRSKLVPLPRAFIGFRPLAIPCQLPGIDPLGKEWSLAARMRFQLLVSPEGPYKGNLHAKIYPRQPKLYEMPENVQVSCTLRRTHRWAYYAPLFAHLSFRMEPVFEIRLTNLLTQESLAIANDKPYRFEIPATVEDHKKKKEGKEEGKTRKNVPRKDEQWTNSEEDNVWINNLLRRYESFVNIV